MEAKLLESQYKNHLSHFRNWEQRAHAEEWILFEKNMGPTSGWTKRHYRRENCIQS